MVFSSIALTSPVIKGAGKLAEGVAIAGLAYALDSVNAMPASTLGQVIKYCAYIGGVYNALRGMSIIAVGE